MNVLSQNKASPKYSLQARPSCTGPRRPEPHSGSYDPKHPETTSKMPKSPRHGFASTSTGRLDPAIQNVPGPGAYTHTGPANAARTPAHVLVSPRQRGAAAAKHKVPGAGCYDPNHPDATSKMSRTARHAFGSSTTGRLDVAAEHVPGPGSYQSKGYIGEASASVAAILSPRHSDRTCRQKSPMATTYNPDGPHVTSKMNRSPNFGFGSSATGRLESGKPDSLGPGRYEHKRHIGSAPGALMVQRPGASSPVKHAHPVASTYEPALPHTTSKMATSPRFNFAKGSTGRLEVASGRAVGPGHYLGHLSQFN